MKRETRVLVLDDEPVVGERLKVSLERTGFVVHAVSDSEQAIAALKEHHYDILVTDLKMSGPDGMEVLKAAREARPHIKPVVITGFATKDTADEAMRLGAAAFIAKPFRMSHLRDVIEQLVGAGKDKDE